jgi:amino acid adenylation domain-containing protein
MMLEKTLNKTLDEFLGELRQLGVKLWVEGDRLRYRAPEGSLTPERLADLKARKAEILAFLQQINTTSAKFSTILPVPRTGNLPLSYTQQRLWLQFQLEPDSPLGNIPNIYRLKGNLNVAALEQSQHEVVRRHEILRATFPTVDRQPTQVIAPELRLPFPTVDLQHWSSGDREIEAQRLSDEEAQRPFDLTQGPLIRLRLLRLQDDEHILIITVHRIICDGSSFDVFFRELIALYKAFSANQTSPLPELPIQYADYAIWQKQWLQSDELELQLNYWKQQLGGNLPTLQLPTDHPRPPLQTYRGSRHYKLFPKTLCDGLNALSQRAGVTLFMTLLAAFKVLLHRYSGQEDLLISFTNAGRGQVETEGLIGPFSNTLVLRTQLAGELDFLDLLDRVRQVALEAYTHQDLPFERVIDAVRPERSRERSPLFQVLFALNPPWLSDRSLSLIELPGLSIKSLFGYVYVGETKFDLTLVMRETDQGLRAVFECNADLFEDDTITRMLAHFQTLLESIVANPNQSLATLPLLKPEQRHQLLVDWNQTQTAYPAACIHQLFEAQVDRTPEATAIGFGQQQVTYRELNQRANQLAHYLQAQGVGAETLVAICVERSPEMLIGLLGILKAGGAYLPLEPAEPHERRASKLRHAQVSLILTQAHLSPLLLDFGAQVVSLDADWEAIAQYDSENPSSPATAENLAYVIYTSGSIGEPKGVTITHRSMVNHSVAVGKVYELTHRDRVLQFSNISFDVMVEELFPTWLCGGAVVLSPAEISTSIPHFLQGIAEQAITVLNLPTAFWHGLVKEMPILKQSLPSDLRLVIVGGERVSKSAYQDWRSQVGSFPRWLNAYGSTETTVTATIYDPLSSPGDLRPDSEIPIGQAIANLQTYVLNRSLQPSPVGVPGELYIGGVGLSPGYLNDSDLTLAQFIPNPFSDVPGARLYKTGDVARYLSDGNLEFIGRADFQLKLQGFRVEPIEIETQLEQYPTVQQAIVLCQEQYPEQKSLVAYLVLQPDQAIDLQELQSFLKQKLPYYMLPDSFMVLETLPLTPNGKVDRRSLPTPTPLDIVSNETLLSYRDDIEQQLTQIWEETLGTQPIGIQDNFFDLGGHSLLAVRMFAQLEETFGKSLPLATLLKAPTIEKLAIVLRQSEWSAPWSPLVEIQTEGSKPPLFCVHGGGFNVLIYRNLAINLGTDQPVYALQARGLDGNQPIVNRLEEMATDYVREIQRIQPEGPYFLSGLSNGGNIALEMAQQLTAQGQEVALVALFDSFGPDGIKLLPSYPRLLSSLYYVLQYSVPRFLTKLFQSGPKPLLAEFQKALSKLEQANRLSDPKASSDQKISTASPSSTDKTSVLEQRMNQISQYILEHSSWAFFSPSAQLREMDDAVSKTLKQLEESYRRVHKAYTPRPYSGRIILFRATERPPGYWLDPQLGWSKIAKDGIEVYKIVGHHTSIMDSLVLAEKMSVCLDNALSSHRLLQTQMRGDENGSTH